MTDGTDDGEQPTRTMRERWRQTASGSASPRTGYGDSGQVTPSLFTLDRHRGSGHGCTRCERLPP